MSIFSSWEKLGNVTDDKTTGINNCNAVAWANQRRLITKKLGGKEVYPNFNQVIDFYKTQRKKFDPSGSKDTNGPGSSEDEGMYLQEALQHLQKTGGPDGVKCVAFAKVDLLNLDEVRAAIATFGCVWVGLDLYRSNEKQFRAKQPWTEPPANEDNSGGHAVLVGEYHHNLKCITWGDIAELTEKFWSKCVFEAYAVIWPEHFGTRSFMLGLDIPLLAEEFKRLTKGDLQIPTAPFSTLHFVKLRNVESGYVELHTANPDSSFALPTAHNVSGFLPNDADNGEWIVEDNDLFFIKTRNCASGKIEVHRTLGQSNYKNFDIHTATVYDAAKAEDGLWTIDGGDLWFIQTKNTTSGRITVERVRQEKNYAVISDSFDTNISPEISKDGVFKMYGGNLYFIRWANTKTEHVEIHRYRSAHQFKSSEVFSTWFNISDGTNGTWTIGANRDLYFVKYRNSGTGKVEVHVATYQSNYNEVYHYASWFEQADGPNGSWCVR